MSRSKNSIEARSLPSTILETCLHVADLQRSREFYADLFGYPVMKSDHRFCAFDVGGRQVLLLFCSRKRSRRDDPAFRHDSAAWSQRPGALGLRHPLRQFVRMETATYRSGYFD